MTVVQGVCQLCNVLGRWCGEKLCATLYNIPIHIGHVTLAHCGTALLCEAFLFLQLFVQLPPGGKLQNEVNARAVVEIAKQPQDIRMSGGWVGGEEGGREKII